MTDEPGIEARLVEQIDYYRARASEYDHWWLRTGRYNFGDEANRRWQSEVAAVYAALDSFAPRGDVLELAAGTGIWTSRLAQYSDRVTAVDTAPETLAINRARMSGSPTPIRYVEADLFDWQPDRRYDVVSFTFWISHVPETHFEHFWELVRSALVPGGRFFFVDNAVPAVDGPIVAGYEGVTDLEDGTSRRRLSTGEEFEIVKVFWSPAGLRARLEALGWSAHVATTDWAFIYGHGHRRA
jgi:SAM-dependent methyltransferase